MNSHSIKYFSNFLTPSKESPALDSATLQLSHIHPRNFPEVRKWVNSNLDNDSNVLLRRVYDALTGVVDGPSIAAAVLIIAKYQYQSAFVADQEINLLAALTEIMVECEFK